MVREAVVAAKAAGGGYVLDGIPRNMEQARAMYLIAVELDMTADVALHLDAGDAEVTRRLLARAALEHRSDDTAEVIAQRLAPVIVGAVLAANGPDAIRIGVLLPSAAVYGFALAVVGVRLAAKVAESKMPEICQVALRTTA